MIIKKFSSKEKQIINSTLEIKPTLFNEDICYLSPLWNAIDFINKINSDTWFMQDNQSFSAKGVFLKLNYQLKLMIHEKFLGVKKGIVFDYKFNLRKNSKTLKKKYSILDINYKK